MKAKRLLSTMWRLAVKFGRAIFVDSDMKNISGVGIKVMGERYLYKEEGGRVAERKNEPRHLELETCKKSSGMSQDEQLRIDSTGNIILPASIRAKLRSSMFIELNELSAGAIIILIQSSDNYPKKPRDI